MTTALRTTGRQVKALLPEPVGKEIDQLQAKLGLSTISNVIALAVRRLYDFEFPDDDQQEIKQPPLLDDIETEKAA